MIKIHNIEEYKPSSGDAFFFDNNVWMYLFCPIANAQQNKQSKYSNLFKKIIAANACIWVNSLVLSEFCNAWLCIEFNNWKKKAQNNAAADYKKDFVNSTAYQDVINEIKETLPQILKKSERTSDDFNRVDLDGIYAELSNCDFNDSYYLAQANINKWKVVTDDADLFKNNNLKLILRC